MYRTSADITRDLVRQIRLGIEVAADVHLVRLPAMNGPERSSRANYCSVCVARGEPEPDLMPNFEGCDEAGCISQAKQTCDEHGGVTIDIMADLYHDRPTGNEVPPYFCLELPIDPAEER